MDPIRISASLKMSNGDQMIEIATFEGRIRILVYVGGTEVARFETSGDDALRIRRLFMLADGAQ